jgi:chemotaxis protein MotB
MPRRKRHQEEEHENLDRWLVSYADFITLLFAFFVTMYAISRVDEKKLGSVVESLQRALGSTFLIQMSRQEPGAFQTSSKPLEVAVVSATEKAQAAAKEDFEKLAAEIKKNMEEGIKNLGEQEQVSLTELKFIIDKRGLVLRFSERFFFPSGDASIRQEVLPTLNVLAQSLEKIPNHIRIEGHTDSVPIRTSRFPSNWELSTARATSIVRYFLTHFQFEPNQLSAAGYGEFRPIAGNETADGRTQNRRVDIVILSAKEKEAEPEGKGA